MPPRKPKAPAEKPKSTQRPTRGAGKEVREDDHFKEFQRFKLQESAAMAALRSRMRKFGEKCDIGEECAKKVLQACSGNPQVSEACTLFLEAFAAIQEEKERVTEATIVLEQKNEATGRLQERWARAGINIAHYTNPSASASLPAVATSTAPPSTQDTSSAVPQPLPFSLIPSSSLPGVPSASSQPIEQFHTVDAPRSQKKRKTMERESHAPPYVYAEAPYLHDIPSLQHHVPRGYAHLTSFAPMHPEPQCNLPQYNLPQYIPPQYNLPQYDLPPHPEQWMFPWTVLNDSMAGL